jgi:hypothetical protein
MQARRRILFCKGANNTKPIKFLLFGCATFSNSPKLSAAPPKVKKWGLAETKASLACGSKSLRFLPPRSVIGVEPTPFQFRLRQSLRPSGLCWARLIGLRCKTALLFSILANSLAEISEIFLGWYNNDVGRFFSHNTGVFFLLSAVLYSTNCH